MPTMSSCSSSSPWHTPNPRFGAYLRPGTIPEFRLYISTFLILCQPRPPDLVCQLFALLLLSGLLPKTHSATVPYPSVIRFPIMKFYIKTFGCRTNIAESEELAGKLSKYFTAAKTPETADFIIIRACAVTAGAEQGVRQATRNYARAKKQIFVIGCFLEKIPGAKYFKSDDKLTEFLIYNNYSGRCSYCMNRKSADIARVPDSPAWFRKTSRAFIKIQSGCNFNCAFCVTRVLRGKSKDESPAKIIRKIKEAESGGAKEIVLSGTNILLYKNICDLIKNILQETDVPRLRFSSVDPRLLTDEFIELFKNPRLMPHLHLSLQSGSEKILSAMRRPTELRKIKMAVKKLRRRNPLFNFSADIIVGFPGETEKDFSKTLALAKDIKLSKIHYFPYSPRPGTPPKSLPDKIIQARLRKIKQLDAVLQKTARRRLSGRLLTILFEGAKNFIYYGYAPNFIRIKHKSKIDLTNKLLPIIIKK